MPRTHRRKILLRLHTPELYKDGISFYDSFVAIKHTTRLPTGAAFFRFLLTAFLIFYYPPTYTIIEAAEHKHGSVVDAAASGFDTFTQAHIHCRIGTPHFWFDMDFEVERKAAAYALLLTCHAARTVPSVVGVAELPLLKAKIRSKQEA